MVFILIIFFVFVIGIGLFVSKKVFLNKSKDSVSVESNKNDNDDLEKKEVGVDLEKAPSSYQDFSLLDDGEYVTSKGFTLKIKDGIAYIDGNVIVNKTYALSVNYQPESPYQEINSEKCNQCINKDVMDAFLLMKSDAASLGLNIYISSGYRSYSYQDKIYNNYVSISGKDKADTYSARPGHSEHQTGTCFDLNTIDDSFANTNEGRWVNENAYLYGFIIRYPKGKESITGYQYESWHLRYVGKELATRLYHDGDWETLEEYYGISSRYE